VTRAGFLFILAAAACTAISNLSLRYGIRHIGGFRAGAFLTDPACMIGLLLQALAALIWFRVLAVMDVSLGYPVLVSITFLLVIAGSVVVFGESMSWRKVAGLVVIVGGIKLAAQS
jgi:multidrug transporter EmrE-like cation transporter